MSVILVPDQQHSHYCYRVSGHLYHFHVLICTHVWNQDSRPAVIYVTASRDYQACCSTHFFKLFLKQQACLWQLHQAIWHIEYKHAFCKICKHICSCGAVSAGLSVTLASDPQLCLNSMLVPDQWAVKHNCTRPSGMYVTVSPDQLACLYMPHIQSACMSLISIHECYIAPSHQPCL